ncbi:phosphatase PAP2 family protein [Patescibacteria group bacterium]|nr:phosphatase PAP2 family protein [Patescibacteria group bacterium]
MDFIKFLDHSLFFWVNDWVGQFMLLDFFAIFCADFLIFFVILLSILFYFLKRRDRLVSVFLKIIIGVLFVYLVSIFLGYILGFFYLRQRPFLAYPSIIHLTDFLASAHKFSFPSDHTAVSLVIALLIFKDWPQWGRVLIGSAILIGLSRVFVGVHYPLDILGGVLNAFLAFTMVRLIFKKKRSSENKQNFLDKV